jgi:UPF0716 family protein affecting phage T7 exclusion
MGVTLAAWAYSYAPRGTLAVSYPPEPAWRVPVIWIGVVAAAIGLFLLVVPWIRKLVLRCRGETEQVVVTITRTKRKSGREKVAHGDGTVETRAQAQTAGRAPDG